jgi:tetratricopeptide (TPR) repeat protein
VRVRQPLTNHIDSPEGVGRRLREARATAGLSQRQLSFPGCTAAYISRIETGDRVPSLQMIHELAGRLGVAPDWLATGDERGQRELDVVDAELALRLGDAVEATRLYEARLAPGDPARAAALAGLGQIALAEERHTEAIELLEQALEERRFALLADPAAVEALGRAHAAVGALEEAIGLFTRALEAAREAEASLEALRFGVLLANALIDHGTFPEAERTLADTVRLSADLHDPLAEARVLWSQSRLHVLRGRPELAARYAQRALAILERTENRGYVGLAHHLLAYARIEAGEHEEALELLAAGRALVGADLVGRIDALFSIEEARALVGLGRSADASRAAERALDELDALDPPDRGRALVALGDVYVAAGDLTRARELYEAGVELLAAQGRPFVQVAAQKLAQLLEDEGDTAGALALLKRAIGSATPLRDSVG